MTKKIYISGKVTGLHPNAAFITFVNKERQLQGKGEIFNPVKFCAHLPKNSSWVEYMRKCIKVLSDCDEIHMLPNWEDSKGAIVEHDLAKALGIKIIYP